MGAGFRSFLEIAGTLAGLSVPALSAMDITVNPWVAAILWTLAAAAFVEFIWRKLPDGRFWFAAKITISVFSVIALVCLVWWSFEREKSPLESETLPGYQASFAVKFDLATVNTPQYLFDSRTTEGGDVAFYLAQSASHFVLKVVDVHGEIHSLDVPTGSATVPLGKFIFITCQVGVSDTATYLQVIIDGEDVAHETIAFPLDFGSKDWMRHTTVFADKDHKNFSRFTIRMFGMGPVTLEKPDYLNLRQIINRFLGAVDANP